MASYRLGSKGKATVSTQPEPGSTYARSLRPGEPAEPTACVIATADGRRIECTLTRKDASTWIARPPEPYSFQDGDRFLIDVLPPGGSVEFADVLGPGQEDWSGRTATRPAT